MRFAQMSGLACGPQFHLGSGQFVDGLGPDHDAKDKLVIA